MKTNSLHLASPLALSAVLAGCTLHVHSPPARALPLETATVLRDGQRSIQLAGSIHNVDFDNRAGSGTVQYRQSLADGWEGSLELTGLYADARATAVPVSRWAGAGRVGVKRRLASDYLSAVAGLGGGAYAAGGYFSPDLGVIAAYENPYFIPFLSVRGGLSQPIAPRTVDLSSDTEPPMTHLSRPITTGFAGVNLGARVPIGPAALLAGIQWQRLFDAEAARTVTSFGLAAETRL